MSDPSKSRVFIPGRSQGPLPGSQPQPQTQPHGHTQGQSGHTLAASTERGGPSHGAQPRPTGPIIFSARKPIAAQQVEGPPLAAAGLQGAVSVSSPAGPGNAVSAGTGKNPGSINPNATAFVPRGANPPASNVPPPVPPAYQHGDSNVQGQGQRQMQGQGQPHWDNYNYGNFYAPPQARAAGYPAQAPTGNPYPSYPPHSHTAHYGEDNSNGSYGNYGNYGYEQAYYDPYQSGEAYYEEDDENMDEIERALDEAFDPEGTGVSEWEGPGGDQSPHSPQSPKMASSEAMDMHRMEEMERESDRAQLAETWIPESRNCPCCHGFRFGCACVKGSTTKCSNAECIAK